MRVLLLFTALCVFTLPGINAQAATVPQITDAAARDMDRQLASSLGVGEAPAKGVSIMLTTPVNVNNFEESNPLARQVQEELTRWFTQAGYEVQEIRKGADVLFEPGTGELVLTRRAELVGAGQPSSTAVMAGTYTITPRNVRFNLRLIATASQQVLGMSSVTIPLTGEVRALLQDSTQGGATIEPSVVTTLP